jgi:hypothetical protein
MAFREHHPNAVIPYLLVITRILPCVLVTTTLGTIITLGGIWNALPLP